MIIMKQLTQAYNTRLCRLEAAQGSVSKGDFFFVRSESRAFPGIARDLTR